VEASNHRKLLWSKAMVVSVTVKGEAEDEGGPLGAAIQVEASNHRKLLWSKAMVVSVTVKGEARLRQVSANGDEHQ